jgi:hypothetical protein
MQAVMVEMQEQFNKVLTTKAVAVAVVLLQQLLPAEQGEMHPQPEEPEEPVLAMVEGALMGVVYLMQLPELLLVAEVVEEEKQLLLQRQALMAGLL